MLKSGEYWEPEMNISAALKEAKRVLGENYVSEPPVDVKAIAENYGISVRETEFPEKFGRVLGFITPNKDKQTAMMIINANDTPESKQFTIAHELGHWLLHKDEILKDPDKTVLLRMSLGDESKDALEKEADAFAAELLVPMDFFEQIGKQKSVEDLAKEFGVSKEVIGYRKKAIPDEPAVEPEVKKAHS